MKRKRAYNKKLHPHVYCLSYASGNETASKCIPIKMYASKYHLSISQIEGLLRRKEIKGVKFRNRMYIEEDS